MVINLSKWIASIVFVVITGNAFAAQAPSTATQVNADSTTGVILCQLLSICLSSDPQDLHWSDR